MAQGTTYSGGLAETKGGRLQKGGSHYHDFHAIEYSFSSKFAAYYVGGNVLVGNPGIEALLHYHIPQGINPKILMLDLVLIQRPGVWPAVQTLVPAKYVAMGKPGQHTDVHIRNQQFGDLTLKVIALP